MKIYDDYYDEDGIMEEAFEIPKRQLIDEARKHLKKEVQEEIDNLRKENQELKDIKDDYNVFKKKEKELENLKVKLEEEYQRKFENLERDFVEKNLIEIFNKYNKVFKKIYTISYNYCPRPKCNLCDENREYEIITPDGLKHKIACKCKEKMTVYKVVEDSNIIYLVFKNRGSEKIQIRLKYFYHDNAHYIDNEDLIEKFDENNIPQSPYGAIFASKEEAQKYCDYLNKLEE